MPPLLNHILAGGQTTILLLYMCAVGMGFAGMSFLQPSTLKMVIEAVRDRRFWVPLCNLVLLAYLIVLACSTTYGGYLEAGEPPVASASFILLRGAPLYPSINSAQRYALYYGPMVYLPFTLALRVIGGNVLALKLVVLLANLLLLWLLWCCYRKLLDSTQAMLCTTLVIMFLLFGHDHLFQVRGDVFLVLAVAVGLWTALCGSVWISAPLLTLAIAFAADIKAFASMYFVPLLVLFIRKHGGRAAFWVAVGAIILVFVPFLSPQISLAAYLALLRNGSNHPLTGELLREAKFLLILAIPVALLSWQLMRRSSSAMKNYLYSNRLFLMILASCVIVVTILASKIGAGSHHFLPFYPIFGYLCVDTYNRAQEVPASTLDLPHLDFVPLLWLWLLSFIVFRLGADLGPTTRILLMSRSHAQAVNDDLRAIMARFQGKTIEMGYGDQKGYDDPGYRITDFRPTLVFAGNPLTIDAIALEDYQLSGDDISSMTLEYLGACTTKIWLIPKGQSPFIMPNIFFLMNPRVLPRASLFGDEFRRTFLEQYRKRGSSQYFDIWECRTEP